MQSRSVLIHVTFAMFIPFVQDRVLQKATGAVCLVLFVNIHNLTVDLFAPRGAGDVIKGVPFAEIAPVNQASLRA